LDPKPKRNRREIGFLPAKAQELVLKAEKGPDLMLRRCKSLLFVGLIGLLLVTGCAHRKHNKPAGPSSPAPTSSNTQIQTSSADSDRAAADAKNDPSFDEFEEEYKAKLVQIADPLAPWNRLMFHFNDKFYFWFFKPIARGYKFVVPGFARRGVNNFFRNLYTPIRFTNSVLQGKGTAAGNEFASFILNTTWGVLGFGQPAQKKFNIPLSDEDLGQTFGVYGIGHGVYIVWPFLGPSTLRDSVGMVGDRFLNPVSYVEPTEAAIGIGFYDRLNETSFRIGEYEALKQAALDPYEAIRDSYIQFRRAAVEK
jgi:phospholipid-binding lipoprotein MlaA